MFSLSSFIHPLCKCAAPASHTAVEGNEIRLKVPEHVACHQGASIWSMKWKEEKSEGVVWDTSHILSSAAEYKYIEEWRVHLKQRAADGVFCCPFLCSNTFSLSLYGHCQDLVLQGWLLWWRAGGEIVLFSFIRWLLWDKHQNLFALSHSPPLSLFIYLFLLFLSHSRSLPFSLAFLPSCLPSLYLSRLGGSE